MDIKIRKHICSNFKNSDKMEIKDSIVSSIASKDEVILPGLGVFFELLWQNSDETLQDTILSTIEKAVTN